MEVDLVHGPTWGEELARRNDAEALAWMVTVLRHSAERRDANFRTIRKTEFLLIDEAVQRDGNGGGVTWGEMLPSPEPTVEDQAISAIHLIEVMQSLAQRELAVVKLASTGLTTTEIAQRLGVSTRTVQRLKTRVADLFRNA